MNLQRILPPIWFFLSIILMISLHIWLPFKQLFFAPFNYLGIAAIIIGIVMVLASAFLFKQKNTTIKPLEESTYLVQEGLFKYSRNPIYLGMTISLLGVGLFLGSLTPFFVIPLFVWLIQTLFIEQEEKMLEEKFGDEYRQYKQKVRRWV